MLDTVLEARGRNCEVDDLLIVLAAEQRIDQAAAEAVAAADTVDDMYMVGCRENTALSLAAS